MNKDFSKKLEELIEKHLPVAFLDYDILMQTKKLVSNKNALGRKEVLIISYLIGADSTESNELLKLSGHRPLYVKIREDAIWKFALDNHWSSKLIIEEIFLQNMEDAYSNSGIIEV